MALPVKRNKVLPTAGVPAAELVTLMRGFHAQDVPRWKDGKASGAVGWVSRNTYTACSLYPRSVCFKVLAVSALSPSNSALNTASFSATCNFHVQVYHGGEEHMALQDEVNNVSALAHSPFLDGANKLFPQKYIHTMDADSVGVLHEHSLDLRRLHVSVFP